ncbi:kynurenine 3-monooxygenase, mitochondrial precursor [Yamadazyma tenuis]|uniref:Kynurenine 3-monooxygenase n=1 Tax=Candida tenuis (strain ATCC 10573 / BCRC 21748 / CBS 615 / JCM 9827 / NBRC 10315 / NRRL Y-1498 / VKM Y-70) TaxID=590646 RepID=G3B698_CANTC|nr:uncharacterized protein CANTEDRAFT_114723 [Yamadazyma tenuis ATCC 10573]XP_006687454.1 kynurenine 3-monooxygenase mitochondrial precursor [Yamadazyma tenuis ATCC 10573]EGV63660.1 hypothetical protein CANTEDRAFT_114723 [Yamadazyma tenuis ATCC 10573]EGV63661.1 kynurenine 3-monooxygenase mitochondrial precursor [Yamadazyma tenuis ATCC 10573]WEJ96757.1 kynurenine 3-monooxygenase, mitochondrial precursor [Yamadazyma tenuis]
MEHQGVGIVGAGIVGCVAALALQARGFSVTLFELRQDPQLEPEMKNLRSINLSLSNRGIRAMDKVDPLLSQRILESSVPLVGRMIHDRTGTKCESQLYGLFGEHNNSIDRSVFNKLLIEETQHRGIKVLFNHRLIAVENKDVPKLSFDVLGEINDFEFDYIIGSDGAFSQFKYQVQKSMRMNTSQDYIDMQYMELYIPPGPQNSFLIDANHLHIWPRDNFMLIALPNSDGSFTSTFFSPWHVIEGIESPEAFGEFFETHFPDAVSLLGKEQLVKAYKEYPRGALIQTSAYPYHSPNKKALLIGDAAHAMVPFYGQGMNCGLEDITVLLELFDQYQDLAVSFEKYSEVRKDDLDTICKLAMDNYNEMASKVTQASFLWRKKIDYYLGKYANGRYFQWIPMYSMISFRDDISYSKAVDIRDTQDRFIRRLELGGALGVLGLALVKGYQAYTRFQRN